ncbi:SETMAR [Cordylochernes scorpioides]|uniref:SETMAR n=1 Tax=Cordylochernes scorpioides TaxID=51811 RepID=A0ABY6LT08_9ARAC|nr:SETMAR [Cordylochernes scorpioides]
MDLQDDDGIPSFEEFDDGSPLMSTFMPGKSDLCAGSFAFYLRTQEKRNRSSSNVLYSTYGNNDPSLKTCKEWFKRFKYEYFDVNEKEHGKSPKRFQE